MSLVAQCSAIGVSVVAHPCAARSIFARHFSRDTVSHCDRGVARWVRQGLFGGGEGWWGMQRDTPATSAKLWEFTARLCARQCVARQVSQQWCDTKDTSHPAAQGVRQKQFSKKGRKVGAGVSQSSFFADFYF